MDSTVKATKIEGKYIKTLYRNYENGYTFFLFKPFDLFITGGNLIKCMGIIPKYTEKMPIILNGEMTNINDKYELSVSDSNIFTKTKTSLLDFLLTIPKCGIGKVKFVKLIEKYGEDIIDKIANVDFQKVLLNEKDLTEEKIKTLQNNISEYVEIKCILDFIQPFGGNYKLANILYQKYGNFSILNVTKHPYELLKTREISFGVCDTIAKKNNYMYYDKDRVEAIVSLALDETKNCESCYFSPDEFKKSIRRIEANQSAYSEWIPESILIMEYVRNENSYIEKVNDEIKIYSKPIYYTEEKIAKELVRLKNKATSFLNKDKILYYKTTNEDKEVKLDLSQANAIEMLYDTEPCILTGGPGTGKTTIIKKLVQIIKKERPDSQIAICAPSGRAAQRIQESTKLRATTIHKLLEYQNNKNNCSDAARNEFNPLEEDFIIVDEFSMVGIFLFVTLLKAIQSGSKLILVGDVNQLESIEPGALLRDIINSNHFRVYELNSIHRQKNGNSIIENSQKIKNGKTDLTIDENFQVIKCKDEEDMLTKTIEIAKKKHNILDIHSFHILSPIKKGTVGIEKINREVQSLFHKDEAYYSYGSNHFYINDKIMTTRNNYDLDNNYYNGDIGIVKDWIGNDIICELNENNITIEFDNMDDLSLAYAMTVHKCQGSEGKSILLLLSHQINKTMLKNSILYTGITRGRENVTILYTGNALNEAILNKGKQRKTSLVSRIEKYRDV